MSECQNLDVRDLLPALARGELEGSQLVAVEAHLATCATCRAELAVITEARTVMHVTPSVDTARIAEAVVRAARVRRDATADVVRARRRSRIAPPSRRVWLAAASVVAVAGAALLATIADREPTVTGVTAPVAQVDQPAPTTPIATPPVDPGRPARGEIVMGGGVSDLADADLEALLSELEGLDAELEIEPAALGPLLEGDV